MYCFENNLLPEVFNSYCLRPSHSYATRYSQNNFVMPKCESRFVEKSIKTIGPKIWATVPNSAKNIPFQKSFSRHMKNIYINSLPTEMSSGRHIDTNQVDSQIVELEQNSLHETPSEDFLGFNLSLEDIFLEETLNEDFLGFDLS